MTKHTKSWMKFTNRTWFKKYRTLQYRDGFFTVCAVPVLRYRGARPKLEHGALNENTIIISYIYIYKILWHLNCIKITMFVKQSIHVVLKTFNIPRCKHDECIINVVLIKYLKF
jgi:hypothetical protein